MNPITIPSFRKIFNGQIFYKKLPLPADNLIIFPLNPDKTFNRAVYSSEMTQERASFSEIDQALTLFEIVYSRRTSASDFLIKVFLRFFLPFMILLYFHKEYVAGEIITLWDCWTIYFVIGVNYLLFDTMRQMKKDKTEIEKLVRIIQPAYRKRGLRWNIPDGHDWIELVKEYCSDEELEGVKSSSNGNEIEENLIKVKVDYEPFSLEFE